MIILLFIIVIIIVITISLFQMKRGGSTTKYYIYTVDKIKFDSEIPQECYAIYVYHELYKVSDKILHSETDRKNHNYFRNYVFANNGWPTFTQSKSLTDLRERIGNDKTDALIKMYNSLKKSTKKLCYSTKYQSKAVWTFDAMNLDNRKKIGYNVTSVDEFKVQMFYRVIVDLSPGDQWSLSDNEEIQQLIADGYTIECFGSSFNTRFKYFGSMSELDKPFGRIGTAFEILDAISKHEVITWNNEIVSDGKTPLKITVNPPSGTLTLYNTVESVIKVLESVSIDIRLHLPNSFLVDIEKSHLPDLRKFCKEEVMLNYAWDLNTGNKKNLNTRQWKLFVLKS